MALRLIIEDEEGATTIVPLGDEEITIGREPGNTIQLTEQNVSRQHARLTPGPDGWVIEDLDSYNGVRVNGVLIEGSVALNEGDVVQIGDYHLAITNNAEQTTLNLDRPGAAASIPEPMRVAPSVDLPRIPAAEAAMLAVGPPTQTTSTTDTDHRDEPGSGGGSRGLLVALLLVLLVGGGLVAYQFVGPKGADPGAGKPEPVTKSDAPKTTEVRPETKQPPEPKQPETPPEPPPENPTTGEEPPPDTTAGEEPIKKTTPKVEKIEKKATPKVEKTEKVEKPKGDPVQLLDEARKANIAGNATQAYDLAKKSYDIDKNTNALALMGASACKMGDQAKAKSVYKKLTDPSRQKQMINVCAERGIMLE